ncbi:BREX-2 system adenine-specific DNA-methyltransferase PglX [Yinghuangia sp. YIM S10712]|uniref:BREX-2 system adenine-specific DNA-methyltransferase PglX n=1 Tax=Yinghuangia sp. YIM S10712 TaxID=3436930 RepID=UPI003F5392FE
MIDRKTLLADLIKQVKAVEADLGRQMADGEAVVKPLRTEHGKAVAADPEGTPAWLEWLAPKLEAMTEDRIGQVRIGEAAGRLREEYDRAKKLGRTGATWNSWIDERITQVAVAWVLGSVFVRFCEDNGLIPEPYLASPEGERQALAEARYREYIDEDANPSYRGWLEKAFEELGAGEAGRLMFDRRHNPLYQIPISHEGAKGLVEFWRERDEAGVLVHDFTDPLNEDGTEGWDTRFLGDLYQDLSEAARKTYALLQTPEFVEEFILDRTMNPVVREMGASFTQLKMIDPTCGSGHFVLGAFRRMLKLMVEKFPGQDRHERVRIALEAVHGVDINPFAVAIARFRLLMAAMAAANLRTLKAANRYDWPVHLAVGDSLIQDRQMELALVGESSGDELAAFSYATEDLHEERHKGILEAGRYDVVVGNPPYITVKDKKLNSLYREIYTSCAGKYTLSVPFAERFFGLAKIGSVDDCGYGRVGQITANSFTKREFGSKLIGEFFAHKVELTEVIDTSGAYIPGHGTPTVILVGKRRSGSSRSARIRTVRGIQGEPTTPANARQGAVWQAILSQIDKPGSYSQWVSVDDLERGKYFGKQPWILTAGGLELVTQLENASSSKLADISSEIGVGALTGEDSAYMTGEGYLRRARIAPDKRRYIVEGTEVRDYGIVDPTLSVWPYSSETMHAEAPLEVEKLLYPYRKVLRDRLYFGKSQVSRGLKWFEYALFLKDRFRAPLSITFAFVATHNHFALDRGGKIFNRTAPIIKLPEGANEDDHLRILGLLNSSTACFWLKMVSHNKGEGGGARVDAGYSAMGSEAWKNHYELTGTKLEEFPIPASHPTALTESLDSLARDIIKTTPQALTLQNVPTAAELKESHARWSATRSQMVALQEELDWQVYSLYQLHTENLSLPQIDVPRLAFGERAFEIVLARRIANGDASDEWFTRHGANPITEIPAHWPDAYKAVVQKRIDAIETNRAIGMIERPEYKRRWATEGWDSMQEKALRAWLLDRIESRDYWFDENDQPTIRTRHQLVDLLARDEDFVSVAELWAPRKELAVVVANLLAEEHVPFLAALRYKPAAMKKRADWEHVWDLQRQEDAAEDEPTKRRIRDSIPVPPKYTSADFLKPSYWRARGKLDVPKERFISYTTGAMPSVPELFGWAGWDHREQAQALATYFTNHDELTPEEMTPLLAGLLELQPWLTQWHNEFDPMYGGSPAAFFDGYRKTQQGDRHLTDDDLRAWRPPAATRTRRTKKA